jgi:intergrase/recombinase
LLPVTRNTAIPSSLNTWTSQKNLKRLLPESHIRFGQQRGQQPPLKRHATDNLLNAEYLGKTLQMLKNSLHLAKQ